MTDWEPTTNDIVRRAIDLGYEIDFTMRPLTEEEKAKGPDILYEELWGDISQKLGMRKDRPMNRNKCTKAQLLEEITSLEDRVKCLKEANRTLHDKMENVEFDGFDKMLDDLERDRAQIKMLQRRCITLRALHQMEEARRHAVEKLNQGISAAMDQLNEQSRFSLLNIGVLKDLAEFFGVTIHMCPKCGALTRGPSDGQTGMRICEKCFEETEWPWPGEKKRKEDKYFLAK